MNSILYHFNSIMQVQSFPYSSSKVGLTQVGLHGLGPLNWMGKKAVYNLVQHNIRFFEKHHHSPSSTFKMFFSSPRQVVEMKAKEVMKKQLADFSLLDINITNNILPQGDFFLNSFMFSFITFLQYIKDIVFASQLSMPFDNWSQYTSKDDLFSGAHV